MPETKYRHLPFCSGIHGLQGVLATDTSPEVFTLAEGTYCTVYATKFKAPHCWHNERDSPQATENSSTCGTITAAGEFPPVLETARRNGGLATFYPAAQGLKAAGTPAQKAPHPTPGTAARAKRGIQEPYCQLQKRDPWKQVDRDMNTELEAQSSSENNYRRRRGESTSVTTAGGTRLQPRSVPAHSRNPTHPNIRRQRSQFRLAKLPEAQNSWAKTMAAEARGGEARVGQTTEGVRCGATTLPRQTTRANKKMEISKTTTQTQVHRG